MPREPRDVCLGTFTGNQRPPDGDVGCQVRGSEPLVLTLEYDFIPGSSPTSPARAWPTSVSCMTQVARSVLMG